VTRKINLLLAILLSVGWLFCIPAHADDQVIGSPTNLIVTENATSITLSWTAPDTGTVQPERYAISFNVPGNGWGIATGNVGDSNALATSITIDNSLLDSLKPAGTAWTFTIRSDNDTLHFYSANSNSVVASTYVTPIIKPLPLPAPNETATIILPISNSEPITSPTPTPAPEPIPTPTPTTLPNPIVVPEPMPAPEPAPQPVVEPTQPAVEPEPPAVEPEPPAVEPEPPAVEPEPPAVEPEPPVVEPEPPAVEPEPPAVEPEPPAVEPEPPVVEPEPPVVEPEPPAVEPEPPLIANKNATDEEKAAIAIELIASLDPGESLTSEQIKEAGLNYSDLPPETPVDVRTDENGNAVIITAEVASNLELLANPTELLATAFTDPGAALAALGSIGADMSPTERKEATDMVVATVVAAGAAMNAVGAAANSTGGSTGGSRSGGGNSGGSGGGGASGESKGVKRRKP
jgi:hypothetical protein